MIVEKITPQIPIGIVLRHDHLGHEEGLGETIGDMPHGELHQVCEGSRQKYFVGGTAATEVRIAIVEHVVAARAVILISLPESRAVGRAVIEGNLRRHRLAVVEVPERDLGIVQIRHGLFFHERPHSDDECLAIVGIDAGASVGNRPERKQLKRIVVVVQGDPPLPHVVDATGAVGRFSRLLHGRQEQGHEDPDDRNHDQQFDERKTARRPLKRRPLRLATTFLFEFRSILGTTFGGQIGKDRGPILPQLGSAERMFARPGRALVMAHASATTARAILFQQALRAPSPQQFRGLEPSFACSPGPADVGGEGRVRGRRDIRSYSNAIGAISREDRRPACRERVYGTSSNCSVLLLKSVIAPVCKLSS